MHKSVRETNIIKKLIAENYIKFSIYPNIHQIEYQNMMGFMELLTSVDPPQITFRKSFVNLKMHTYS